MPSTVTRPLLPNGNISTESAFLNLPPELRNCIYECVVQNTITLSLKKDRILYVPPLSLVCRQIRKEYEEIFLDEAAKYATALRIHITNFAHKDVAPIYSSLPALAPGVDSSLCTITVVIRLTNMFDSCLHHLRTLLWSGYGLDKMEGARPLCSTPAFKVVVDPQSFDVSYFRQLLPKLQWAHGLHGGREARNSWPLLHDAFQEAISSCPSGPIQKSRRRRSAKVSRPVKRRKINHSLS